MDNPLVALLFGAATVFGGGALGARVPLKTPPPEPMTRRQQVVLGVTFYGPLFVVPAVVWLITRSMLMTVVWSGLVWVAMFFVAVLIAGVVAYVRSRRGAH